MPQRFDKVPFSELIVGDVFTTRMPSNSRSNPATVRYTKIGRNKVRRHSGETVGFVRREYNNERIAKLDVYFLRHDTLWNVKEPSAPPVAAGSESKKESK